MKRTKRFSLLLVVGVLLLSVFGCGGQKNNSIDPQMLVVERHRVQIETSSNDSYPITADFVVDIPLYGPQSLMDSLEVFINKTLYEEFDHSFEPWDGWDSVPFSENEWFEYDKLGWELTDILEYYVHKYSPYTEQLFNTKSCSVLLVAQTDAFVTFGIEYWGCGGSCGSNLYCHTFSKKDGHKIGQIIEEQDIYRFFEDHPEVEPYYSEFGLLEDGVLCIDEDQQNHYCASYCEYKELLPYLSSEAQELVNSIGKTKYSDEDWSLGEQIGSVKTTGGKDVYLMRRPPLWDGFVDFCADGTLPQGVIYTLTAYTNQDGRYVKEEKVLPKPRMEFEFPHVAWEGPYSLWDRDYFIYDDEQNMLFVPEKIGDWKVEFTPLHFNGERFVSVNEKDCTPPEHLQEIAVLPYYGKPDDEKEAVHLMAGDGYLKAYNVRNGMYIPKRAFPRWEYAIRCPEFEYEISSNPGEVECFTFVSSDSTLYVPYVERHGMSLYIHPDLYYVYKYDGYRFISHGLEGGYWLHPSLRKFAELWYLGRSKDYLVRVDEMRRLQDPELYDPDFDYGPTSYRFAAWKNKDNMLDAPDLVIENGYWDRDRYCCVFQNNGSTYEVFFDTSDPDNSEPSKLTIYQKGKKVLEQQLDDLWH